jgi:hypothetical protein
MSRDDLLADLQGERSARLAAPPVPPPSAPTAGAQPATPALDVSVTPLKWSLPRMSAAAHGLGLAVRVGPLHVTLGMR